MNYKNLTYQELQEWFSESDFKTEPYWHQLVSIATIISKGWQRVNLAPVGIGLGKTLIALYTLKLWNIQGRTLVICPNSVIETWKEEIEKHTNFTYCILKGSKQERLAKITIEKADIFIINYEGLKVICTDRINGKNVLNPAYPKNFGFECIISDESHRYRNEKTTQSRCSFHFTSRARYVINMTGSPIADNAIDLFGQYYVLDNGHTFGMNKGKFLYHYFYKSNKFDYNWTPKRICHICGELYDFKNRHLSTHKISLDNYRKKFPDKEITSEEIILEATKHNSIQFSREECLDLPDKIYEVREVFPTMEQRKTMTEIINGIDLTILNKKTIEKHTLKLVQVIGGTLLYENGKVYEFPRNPKLNELKSLIEEIDGKMIIFFSFVAEGKMIGKMLKKIRMEFAEIHGGIKDKGKELRKFREERNCRVLLGHPRSSGEGLNIQIANTIIYYNNGYIGTTVRQQSEGRIHRAGQKNTCVFIDIVMRNSIDQIIFDSLKNRKEHTEELLAYLKKKNPP